MKVTKVFLFCIMSFLASSCVTWNTHSYSINNLDKKGKIDNNNFSVSYEDGFDILFDASGNFTIRNNKDSVLYIDMGNSYFLDSESQAERLFTNTVQTTYSSSTSGVGLNLGSVARVLGAGPITSALASGITVGGTNTTGVAIQKIEDQYIGIPPYASVKIKFPTLGTDVPFEKKKGTFVYNKPSESQILSYTYTSDNPKWTIVRNQFVLEKIVAETSGKGEEIGRNDKACTNLLTVEIMTSDKTNESKFWSSSRSQFKAFAIIGGSSAALLSIFTIVYLMARH